MIENSELKHFIRAELHAVHQVIEALPDRLANYRARQRECDLLAASNILQEFELSSNAPATRMP